MAESNPSDNLDLGAQLDALINQIREQEPQLVKGALPAAKDEKDPSKNDEPPASNASEETSSTEGLDIDLKSPIDALLEQQVETEGDAAPDDSSEEHLDNQIQELLVDAASQPSSDQAEAVAEEPVEEQAATSQESASGQDEDDSKESMTMEAIDELLAEQAEEAVAGDFETVNDVLAAEQAKKTEEPVLLDNESTPTASEIKEEESLEGAFVKPEDVMGEQDDGGFDADAEAVAEELDEATNDAATDTADKATDETDPGQADQIKRRRKLNLVIFSTALKHTCRTINRPISRLSPANRQLVGYIALLTVFNGAIFFGFGLIKKMFGGG